MTLLPLPAVWPQKQPQPQSQRLLLPLLLLLGAAGTTSGQGPGENFHTPSFQSDAVDQQTCYRLQLTGGRALLPPLPLLPLTHLRNGTRIAGLTAVYPYEGAAGPQGPATGLETPATAQVSCKTGTVVRLLQRWRMGRGGRALYVLWGLLVVSLRR